MANCSFKRVVVYDNGGKTTDRYTVIISGHAYGMSSNASSPQGFNQYIGPSRELLKKNLGRRVAITNLSESTKKAICERKKR